MNTAHVKNAIKGRGNGQSAKGKKDFNVKQIIDWRNFNLPEHMPIGGHVTNTSVKQWVWILRMPKIDRAHFGHVTRYELTHFKKMVRVWKNQIATILFKIWPTKRFSKAKSCNFIFIKTMSHDLLVQMAYRTYFLQCLHHGCLLLNKREQVTHYGTTNQKFANAYGRRNKQKGVLDRRPLFPFLPAPSPQPPPPPHPPFPFDVHQAG